MAKEKPKSAMAALLDFTTNDNAVATQELIDKQAPVLQTAVESATAKQEKALPTSTPLLIKVNPGDCVLWRFADRPSDELGDLEALAHSLKSHGQQEPILVRRNQQKTPHQYEVVFGNRRWRAARIANIQLEAIYKNVSDQQASLSQKEENENHEAISNYARALSYRAQIDGGVFKNESELSQYLGLSKQTLNDIMAYLRVPKVLRGAISNYKNLSKNMVRKLATLSRNKDVLDVLLHFAPKINDKTVTTSNLDRQIHRYLSPHIRSKKQVYVKKDEQGNLAYRIERQKGGKLAVTISKPFSQKIDISILQEKLLGLLNELATMEG